MKVIHYIQLHTTFPLLLHFTFLLCSNIFGATNNSVSSGNWTTAAVWSSGVPTSSQDVNVSSGHSITANQNLTLSSTAAWVYNGSVIDATGGSAYSLVVGGHSSLTVKSTFTMEGTGTIEDHGELVVNGAAGTTMTIGSLTLKDHAVINVAAGCTLIVMGTLTMEDHMSFTLNGVLTINGSASATDHAAVVGTTGSLSSTGPVAVTAHASIFGSRNQCASGPCFATPTSPLPITLISFNAKKEGKSIKLIWSTATETNNDFFTLEKSLNGISFDKLGVVKGSGNSTTQVDYSYVDDRPSEGNTYYRLTQTDYDGKYEVFPEITIYYELTDDGNCVLKVFPNPCISQCNVLLEGCDNSANPDILVEVIDAAGNKVFSKVPFTDEKGQFNFLIDSDNNLKPGIYIVRGSSKKSSYTQRMIVK